jgi:hypothetical protein
MISTTEERTIPAPENGAAEHVDGRVRTTKSALEHFREYEQDRPDIVALWCLGIGFVLGWKLKPW